MTKRTNLVADAADVLDPLLTINDTAAYLAVHRDSVYKLMNNGMLPYLTLNGRRRIRQSDLMAYVDLAAAGA